MTGNDDLGAMSAWHVLSALGIYPISAIADVYGLTSPLFPRVNLTLDPAWWPPGRLVITAAAANATTERFIAAAAVDGQPVNAAWLDGTALRQAEALHFDLAAEPGHWATAPSAAPPAFCKTQPHYPPDG